MNNIAHIETTGCEYLKDDGRLIWFHDPATGSTLCLLSREYTAEQVAEHVRESRKKFYGGNDK
jgi:hypothetical protein